MKRSASNDGPFCKCVCRYQSTQENANTFQMGNNRGSYAQLTCSAFEISNFPAHFICQFSTASKYADFSTGRQEQFCVQPILVVAGRRPEVGRRMTIQVMSGHLCFSLMRCPSYCTIAGRNGQGCTSASHSTQREDLESLSLGETVECCLL